LILAARSTDKLEKLSLELAENEISPKGGPLYKPQYCYLDVEAIVNDKTKLAEFLTALKHAQQQQGGDQRVDVLVNNAGQMAYGEGAHTDLAVLKRMLDVNYLGQVALTQALWEQIPEDGAIVLLGSIVGRVALPYMGAYSAAKHAVQVRHN
jgi:dehydrogenase/reductase SDR family protein 7B